MTQIAHLPTISVKIAFNPTNVNSTTQTWTDVSYLCRSFQSKKGRQHFLDRIEAGTLDGMFSNRDGFLTNGSVNGTGYALRARLPIKVSVTWSSVTYPIFYGLIDNVEEQVQDMLNSDMRIQATDFLKNLSLRNVYAPNLYGQYVTQPTYSGATVTAPGAANWYRFGLTDVAGNNVADALPYSATQYLSGVSVSLVGFPNAPTANAVAAGASTNQTQAQQGVCIYDTRSCIDLTNGTGTAAGGITLGVKSGSICLDFWVLGINLANSQLTNNLFGSGGEADLICDSAGRLGITGDTTVCPLPINDGYWHHVSIVADWSGSKIILGVDGHFTTTNTTTTGLFGVGSSGGALTIGITGAGAYTASCYVDNVVITQVPITGSWNATIQAQVAARAAVGSLLLRDTTAGDMIAQALIVAGFGSITTSGTTAYYSVNQLAIDGSTYSNSNFAIPTPNYGVAQYQGYQSGQGAITTSSLFDIITTVCDTEIGRFYQTGLGSFVFHTRAYIYRAAGRSSAYTLMDQLDTANNYQSSNLSIIQDDADIWTTVRMTVQNGTEQIYENTAAEATMGYSTLSKTTNATTLAQAQATAQYLGSLYQKGLPRVQSLELTARTAAGNLLPQMLSSEVDLRVTFQRTMPNAPQLNLDMLIEAVTHDFESEASDWTTTLILDPYPLQIQTQQSKWYMIADDTTYGLADGQNVAI